MDARVLEAQQWVNNTYRSVAGYVLAPETGRTGWSTMYSLTRALQYELGITTLSDSFGPTTLAKLAERGGVGTDERNLNLIKILQCACYCKGYDPRGITGNVNAMMSAVRRMEADAGLPDTDPSAPELQPKSIKALLSMDAYVVVLGGTEAVRTIQRWLNNRYLKRKNFFVGPCDGNFSRDVQKSLMLAIQFELGLSDDQATGSFGPTTQNGLRGRNLAVGASGVFVNLFSAAMVFNGYGSFVGSFDAALADEVRDFQDFSELGATGTADYPTWAQLLVSTGDPARPGSACDCRTTITPARAQSLFSAGYRYVGRYLDNVPGGFNKKIQPGELQVIFDNGLKLFPISQYDGGSASYFTYQAGYQDAVKADSAALAHGIPLGSVLYFAVDYDATQAEIDARIVPYFRGVVAGLAANQKRYLHGVYGSRNVCAQVTRSTLARWSFVSGMSTGFSGNLGYPLPINWSFNQIQTLTVGMGAGSIEIDKNIYRPGTDAAVGAVGTQPRDVDRFVAHIAQLYDLAVAFGQGDPNDLVLDYVRTPEYADEQWAALLGRDVNRGFIDYVNQRNVPKVPTFVDQTTGITVNTDHLAASCTGVLRFGAPPAGTTTRSDVGGWGGDLFTFYGEWRRDSASYSSGYAYCMERLAKVEPEGSSATFKYNDLIEDADSYNIASNIRQGLNVVDAVTIYYRGGGSNARLELFYGRRFGNSQATAAALATYILTYTDDEVVKVGRSFLIQKYGGVPTTFPSDLPGGKLDEFCRGFAQVLADRVDLENPPR